MSKFKKIPLGELIEFQRGYDLPRSSFVNGQYPVVSSNGILWYHNEFKSKWPGITIWRSGTVGIPQYIKSDFYPHNTSLFVKDFKWNYPLYIFYLLKTLGLHNRKTWSGVPTMNRNHLHPLLVLANSDTFDQQQIASILSTLDIKIELNNKINTELEAMAKTLYDCRFVQFEFPNENGKPYKSSGGEMVWNEELKRDIPQGWTVENLKTNSLTTLIKPGIDEFQGQKTYLATADVINNDINLWANKISFENRESRANMQPIENSIWFAKMKKSKKVLYFGNYSTFYLENFILSTGFAGLKCTSDHYLEYIWWFINNDSFETIKDRLSNGATQEAINNDSMALIPLIIPNEDTLKEYHQKTFEMYKKIYLNQIENQKLTELRDWLLPMLMNGQVVVE
jgi:type I restriction enzyme, S subunit